MSDGPVRIQILSDLHLEVPPPRRSRLLDSYHFTFPAEAEILALLGDIGATTDDGLFDWLYAQLKRFKTVFFLSGNHESYGSSMEESNRRIIDFAHKCQAMHEQATLQEPFGRFILLDRTRYDISETVTVLGCTLWSRLDPSRRHAIHLGLNDFSQIQDFTPSVYNSLFERDLAWLERSISDISAEEPHRRIVVMTHHAPTVEGTSNPQYQDSPLTSAFSTELVGGPCWKGKVKVWAFGHTHWACDFEREGVRVVSNPKGYGRGVDRGFVPEKVVEV
ncbi:Ser/Thr protein phosphatase protein [Trametes versicolor FP-101664 SS1]|uniref:Ser/Thr protein phosphatase protein n=1 Tax=Trametes versicolor (strain FP-101664) TaxID=717944 RepID=UPI0004623228|nr:Ser/Thr protein phosphatase protein [Trametes versicolor FP-101664 SS1]EIW64566.1 Ser/Thr protein phosphatase protein [Trametes versicolor FP-101664 SS1]